MVGDRRITWREFDDRAARLAAALAELGVGPRRQGRAVPLQLPRVPRVRVRLVQGCRAVPVNVNYRYLDDELVYLLRRLGGQGAGVPRLAGRADRGRPRPHPRRARWCRSTTARRWSTGRTATRTSSPVTSRPPASVRSGQDHFMLYTGGTTGMPKGVVWAHDDLFTTLGYPRYTTLGLDIPTEPARGRARPRCRCASRAVARDAVGPAADARHRAVPVHVDVPARPAPSSCSRAAASTPTRCSSSSQRERRHPAHHRRRRVRPPAGGGARAGRRRGPALRPVLAPADLQLGDDVERAAQAAVPGAWPDGAARHGRRQRGRPVRGGDVDAGRRPGDGHLQDRRALRGVRRGLEADPPRHREGRRPRRQRRRSARLPRRRRRSRRPRSA